jgi:hypothetical protein
MSKSRVIQVLRDPHVVLECSEDKATLLCEYRTLIELEGGEVVLISTTADDMKEGYTAEELYGECGHFGKEIEDVTEDCIIDSIEAWRNADRNTIDEPPAVTAKWVLSQFVKAGMIRKGLSPKSRLCSCT